MHRPHATGDLAAKGGIDALAAVLKTMNPYPLGNAKDECESFAREVILVLKEGRDPRPVLSVGPPDDQGLKDWRDGQVETWNMLKQQEGAGGPQAPAGARVNALGEHRLVTNAPWPEATASADQDTVFPPGPARAQQAFQWLSQLGRGECVYEARGGGHVWNFFRSAGQVFLIDASCGVYKKLLRAGDARATYWRNAEQKLVFDYCDPVDLFDTQQHKKLTLRNCGGPIHGRWRRLLHPGFGAYGEAPV
jgi:hypothetical protein